jgi:hypothetical protein
VVCAKTPLTITGIAGLLSLPEKTTIGHINTLRSVLNVDTAQSVLMFHASFPEFMVNASRVSIERCCKVPEHNTTLSLGCFKLLQKFLRFNICGLESSFICDDNVEGLKQVVKESIPSHVIYACCYWADHLKSSSGSITALCENLWTFLSSYLLFWMEVMNLKKTSNLCGPMLLEARLWIKVYTL